jgi:hypothetical protein
MTELLDFLNRDIPEQYDLIRVAPAPNETKILHRVPDVYPLQNQDTRTVLPRLGQVQVSRILAGLRDRSLLVTEEPGGRKYFLGISKGTLLREVMRRLDSKGFLPLKGAV